MGLTVFFCFTFAKIFTSAASAFAFSSASAAFLFASVFAVSVVFCSFSVFDSFFLLVHLSVIVVVASCCEFFGRF